MASERRKVKRDSLGRRTDRVRRREANKMEKLSDQGWGVKDIARYLGRDPRTVADHLRHLSGVGAGERRAIPAGLRRFAVGLAEELGKLRASPLRSFSLHKLSLAALDVVGLGLRRRFPDWEGWARLDHVEGLLDRRRALQGRLAEELGNHPAIGNGSPVQPHLGLAAYHYLVRGNEGWLSLERLQVLVLGGESAVLKGLGCQVWDCPYEVPVSSWDTREFACPEHGQGLTVAWEGLPRLAVSAMLLGKLPPGVYQERVLGVEALRERYGGVAALSLRIPGVWPFTEVVLVVGDEPSVRELKHALPDAFKALGTSSIAGEVRHTEEQLDSAWGELLEALAEAAGPVQISV
jgi:DNA-binding MarR family transcriptional regulator